MALLGEGQQAAAVGEDRAVGLSFVVCRARCLVALCRGRRHLRWVHLARWGLATLWPCEKATPMAVVPWATHIGESASMGDRLQRKSLPVAIATGAGHEDRFVFDYSPNHNLQKRDASPSRGQLY